MDGEGDPHAKIMLVGEAPGAQEDLEGRPFVGRSGKFLETVLSKNGISRSEVFITNVVRCRPPNNRKPTDDEIESCVPHLRREIGKIRPKVVVALGAVAVGAISGRKGGLKDVIAKTIVTKFGGVEFNLIPCYHPAAAMRNRKMRTGFERAIMVAASSAPKG